MNYILSLSVALAVATTVVGTQAVHVVDVNNGVGTDATTIMGAVDVAASGDIVLIRSGDYDEIVVIDGIGLTLIADSDASVEVSGVTIENVASDEFVAIRGLQVSGDGDAVNYSIWLERCDGPVWFEDVVACPPPVMPSLASGLGVLNAYKCQSVVFDGCRLLPGSLHNYDPNVALDGNCLGESSVFFFDTYLEGPPGADTEFVAPTIGVPALTIRTSRVWLYGCTLQGGKGGSSLPGNTSYNSVRGGPGIRAPGSTSEIIRLDTSIVGGKGGAPSGSSKPGPMGLEIAGAPAVYDVVGDARSHSIDSLYRPNETITGVFGGEPGERVDLWLSAQPGFGRDFRVVGGPLVLDSPLTHALRMKLDSSGTFAASGPSFDPTPAEGVVIFSQALHSGSTGLIIGPPTMTVFLDPTH